MALQSKVPIMPGHVNFESFSGYFRLLWHWDKKKIPLPFSEMKLSFSKPVNVKSKDDFPSLTDYIGAKL